MNRNRNEQRLPRVADRPAIMTTTAGPVPTNSTLTGAIEDGLKALAECRSHTVDIATKLTGESPAPSGVLDAPDSLQRLTGLLVAGLQDLRFRLADINGTL